MGELGVDAPLGAERSDGRVVASAVARVTVGRMIFGEQLRDVETDAAGADDRYPLAREGLLSNSGSVESRSSR